MIRNTPDAVSAAHAAEAGAPGLEISDRAMKAAVEAASDWLADNRDSIEAGGEGDLPELVRRVASAVSA